VKVAFSVTRCVVAWWRQKAAFCEPWLLCCPVLLVDLLIDDDAMTLDLVC
jgi:hypothetical protein